jgi:hypothetical protein
VKSKFGDAYSAIFGVEVGKLQLGPIGRFLNKKSPLQGIPTIQSGDDIDLSLFPPDNPAGKWGTWDVGPVEIAPQDIIAVNYAFINTSDNGPSLSSGDQTKIGVTTWSAIVSVGLAASGVGAVAAAIVAGVGAVLGEILGAIIKDIPKCNGTAFANKIIRTGSQLVAETNQLTQVEIITDHSGNPDIPTDCGTPSVGDVTISVTPVLTESVKGFLGRKGDLSQGIKKGLNLTQTPISIRSLIEAR